MVGNLKLAELVVTKMCHDLSGPVGAVNNGIELLKDGSENIHDKSIELIEISAQEAVSRLLFFRQAYGVLHSHSQVNEDSLREIVVKFFAQKKITIIWPDSSQEMTNEMGKILLNTILVVSQALIHGGELSVNHHENDGFSVAAKGEGLKVDMEITDVLQHKENIVNIKNIQAYVIKEMVEAANVVLAIKHTDTLFEIRVDKK